MKRLSFATCGLRRSEVTNIIYKNTLPVQGSPRVQPKVSGKLNSGFTIKGKLK